jgi:hypothetical protein
MDFYDNVGESMGMSSGTMFLVVIVAILVIIGQWKIFEKAGQPGWASLIPFFNVIVLLNIIGRPWWWMLLLMFIPVVNIILWIIIANDLSKSFGQGIGFTLGLIFLTPIFILVLGFGNYNYIGPGSSL